jgi:hypothetical protein
MPGAEGESQISNKPGEDKDGHGANQEVDDDSVDPGSQEPVGDRLLHLYKQEALTLSVKYRTKWFNLGFVLVAIVLFFGLSQIEGVDDFILWPILIFLLLLDTAAIFDFFASPTWVLIESNRK